MSDTIIEKDKIGVGDLSSSERGTAARFNVGKTPWEFLPIHLFAGAARIFKAVTERKVNPYPPFNWAKGQRFSAPVACILRHASALQRGELRDPDTNEYHWQHIVCNCAILEQSSIVYPDGNDLPDPGLWEPKTDTGRGADTQTDGRGVLDAVSYYHAFTT